MSKKNIVLHCNIYYIVIVIRCKIEINFRRIERGNMHKGIGQCGKKRLNGVVIISFNEANIICLF